MVNLQNFIPSSGMISLIITGILWLVLAGGGIAGLVMFIRNKLKYKYYGEINKRRYWDDESPFSQTKHIEGKAGYFNSRKNGQVFRIKYGLMPWHIIELKKKPNPEYMLDNKVYYNQYNEHQLIQAKAQIDWDYNGVKISPIDSNLKDEIEYDISSRERVLATSPNKTMIIGMSILGFILVAGIIVIWFMTKA